MIDFNAAVGGNVHRNFLGICFLILIMLPTLITIAIWSTVIIYNQAQRLGWIMFPPNNKLLSNVINKVSCAMGGRMPLCIVERNKVCFTVKVPLLFGGPYIVINRSFLENFNSSEIEAADAHELVHVKYDAKAIRLTQWASILLLFPCNAFALLLNMEKREMRADSIASKIVGNRDVLMTALVKVCMGQVSASEVKVAASELIKDNVVLPTKLWYRIANYVLLLYPFFWPESILGYMHPAIQDRMILLRTPSLTQDQNSHTIDKKKVT
jgi:Zn-dependent protease with chaperone function